MAQINFLHPETPSSGPLPTRLARPQLEDPLRQRLAMCRLGLRFFSVKKKRGEPGGLRWWVLVDSFCQTKKSLLHSGVAKLQEFIFIIIFNVEL